MILLALSVAGCAAPTHPVPRGADVLADFDADDVTALVDDAVVRYDVALMSALLDWELADLAASNGTPDRERLQRLARVGHRLADTLKFDATCLPEGAQRDRSIQERLVVAAQVLDWLEPGLERDPDDATLTFAVGELLAFRIDGILSGLRFGDRSRTLLERAVELAAEDGASSAAGAGAELGLARRFYYLPTIAGGDIARAEAALMDVLARYPEHEPTWAFLGEVRHVRGDLAGARSALEHARALNPDSPRARVLLTNPELELEREL